MKESHKKMTLLVDDCMVSYDSQASPEITHNTRHGVRVDITIPSDWAVTRIMQFMEDLLENNIEEISDIKYKIN